MKSKTNNFLLRRFLIEKISMLAFATILLTGISAFTTEDNKWYSSPNAGETDFSQPLNYDVHGAYDHPVKRNKLNDAKLISDFIESYPVNWITNYVSVEFLAKANGKEVRAMGKNNILSAEQKNILKTVDLGTLLEINVKYRYKNSVTDNLEEYQMQAKLMVIPEIEAEYIGGNSQLNNYLWKSAVSKISSSFASRSRHATLKFTINESGEAINAHFTTSSGDDKTDALMLDAINKMPKWKPAADANGIKVKQEFEFRVGNDGC